MDPDDIDDFDPFLAGIEDRPFPFFGRGKPPFGFPFGGDGEDADDEEYIEDETDDGDDTEIERSEEARFARVVADEDGTLTFTGTQFGDVGVYQARDRPFTPEFSYYEVEILNWGRAGRIGIGLAHAHYSLRRQPGWEANSIAYHCDDGRLFHNSGFGRGFTAPAEVGDIIGCGIEVNGESVEGVVRAFFTRNGTELGSARVRVPSSGFFPTIGLHSQGESVRVNWSATWPPEQDDEMTGEDRSADPTSKWTRLSKVIRKDGLLCYTGLGKSDSDGGIALGSTPLTPYNHYFELEIVDSGDKGYVAIGIARKDYPTYRHPGWNPGSVAYHADDGKLFHGEGTGRNFGPSCHQGDRMGCGIKFLEEEEEEDEVEDEEEVLDASSSLDAREGARVEVYFTRNGKRVGKTNAKVPPGGFYPIIGMLSRGEKVRPDLNAITG